MKVRELFINESIHDSEEYTDPEKYILLLHKVFLGNKSINTSQRVRLNAAEYSEDSNSISIINCNHPKFDASLLYNRELPFQIDDFDGGHFQYVENLNANTLKSLKNFPKRIKTNFNLVASGITDFSDGPESVESICSIQSYAKSITNLSIEAPMLRLSYPNLEKLSGLGDSKIEQIELINCHNIKSHILSLLKIKKLEIVVYVANSLKPWENNTTDFNNALAILNRHLMGNRDILACQEELIEAGLKEFARL